MFLLERSKSLYLLESLGWLLLTAVSIMHPHRQQLCWDCQQSSCAWMGTCRQLGQAFEAGVLILGELNPFYASRRCNGHGPMNFAKHFFNCLYNPSKQNFLFPNMYFIVGPPSAIVINSFLLIFHSHILHQAPLDIGI